MKKQSISLVLTISFSFLFCVLLGLGWLGLSRMGHINADLQDLVTKRWAKVQFCREALGYSNLKTESPWSYFCWTTPAKSRHCSRVEPRTPIKSLPLYARSKNSVSNQEKNANFSMRSWRPENRTSPATSKRFICSLTSTNTRRRERPCWIRRYLC